MLKKCIMIRRHKKVSIACALLYWKGKERIKTWKSLGRGMRGASRGGRRRGREAGGTDLGQAVPTVKGLAPEAEDF